MTINQGERAVDQGGVPSRLPLDFPSLEEETSDDAVNARLGADITPACGR